MKNQRIRLGQTNTAILNGSMDLSTWTDEELIRGQRRDKNGHFQGRPPKVVPLAVHKEMTRRKMQEVHDHLRDNVLEAAQALTAMIRNPAVDDSAKVKAIGMVFDRMLGSAPVKVEVATVSPIDEDLEYITTYDDSDIIDVDSQDVRRSLRSPENG